LEAINNGWVLGWFYYWLQVCSGIQLYCASVGVNALYNALKASKIVLQLLCQLCDHIGCQIGWGLSETQKWVLFRVIGDKNIGYYSIYGATVSTELCKAPSARVATLSCQFQRLVQRNCYHIWCRHGNPEMSVVPSYRWQFNTHISIRILHKKNTIYTGHIQVWLL
jgi:hypothetical protein